MQPTHNTLSENVRAQSAELLNVHLAAAIDLHGQLKQAHWNVRGPTFIAVHELFDKVAETVEGYADQIAERAAGLGAIAEGTIQVAAERSFLVPRRREAASVRSRLDIGRLRPIRPRGDRQGGRLWRCRHRRPLHRSFAWARSSALVRRGSYRAKLKRPSRREKASPCGSFDTSTQAARFSSLARLGRRRRPPSGGKLRSRNARHRKER